MSILKKIVDLFSEEVEADDDKTDEREKLKKELLEESKKYKEISKPVEVESNLEEVNKQVLFVDEDFERKEKKSEPKPEVKSESAFNKTKYISEEPKFKPSSYISPVHGLIKEAEEIEVQEHEEKTVSESDYAKIRERVFNDGKQNVDELDDSANFKIFKTSEIINIKRRIQVDEDEIYDETTSIEDAYAHASDDNYVDTKNFNNGQAPSQSDLFNLLDELKEENNE